MITNFEEITAELKDEELDLIPLLIAGFKTHYVANPIKAPEIVELMNTYLISNGIGIRLNPARLRKCCNYIRSNSLIPLIATSKGYYISYDKVVIESQINSLIERSNSIKRSAEGIAKFLL